MVRIKPKSRIPAAIGWIAARGSWESMETSASVNLDSTLLSNDSSAGSIAELRHETTRSRVALTSVGPSNPLVASAADA